jgi:hypothetical protein
LIGTIKCALLCVIISIAPVSAARPPKLPKHSITVKFDYDFHLTPPCSPEAKKNCVSEFVVYDISQGKKIKLTSFPVPAGAKGKVQGISATTPRFEFAKGKHIIAVVARAPDGAESDPKQCTTIVKVR